MIWVLVLLACVFFAIKFRGFRYMVMGILFLLVLVVAVFLSRQHEDQDKAKHLVRPDQLVFSDLRLGPENFDPSTYVPTGRVRNDSEFTVFDVVAKIRVLDCGSEAHCNVVGEEKTFDMVPLLPPGQVRDINTDVYFGSGTRVHGKFEWNYDITEIQARAGN